MVRVMDPKKLLILILNINKKDYGSFKEQADQIFNVRFHEQDIVIDARTGERFNKRTKEFEW